MIINHNISALNTYRQLSINNSATAKNLEKLSSGLRINRAGDDAAGLAISEKMRGQIRGLNMASKNAQDGISLIQTAEGALNETHAILQRMRELAVQSANDTNTASDRAELQKEIDQLAEELARIGNTTEFNTQTLLNGKFSGTFHIGANEQQNLKISISDMRGFALGVTGKAKLNEAVTINQGSGADITNGTYTVEGTNLVDSGGNVVATTTDGKTWTAVSGVGSGNDTFTFSAALASGTQVKISGTTAIASVQVQNKGLQAGSYTIDATNGELKDANGNVVAKLSGNDFVSTADGNIVLTINGTVIDTEVTVGGIDISSQKSADSAITVIQQAIDRVSTERAKLGAYQNRLEHTINNLGTSAENLQAAESRIRDVDYALTA